MASIAVAFLSWKGATREHAVAIERAERGGCTTTTVSMRDGARTNTDAPLPRQTRFARSASTSSPLFIVDLPSTSSSRASFRSSSTVRSS